MREKPRISAFVMIAGLGTWSCRASGVNDRVPRETIIERIPCVRLRAPNGQTPPE